MSFSEKIGVSYKVYESLTWEGSQTALSIGDQSAVAIFDEDEYLSCIYIEEKNRS